DGKRNDGGEDRRRHVHVVGPLAIYFLSGRWFVRGIAAGAVKG
ncbi:carbohydrate ABC transporter permease, partial [Rhizobium ruizarguesonis]